MKLLVQVLLNWIGTALGISRWFGWAGFRTLMIAAAERLATVGGIAVTSAITLLFDALIDGVDEWRDKIASYILDKAGIEIEPSELLNQEAWKAAIGVRAAGLINIELGTEFQTVYPPTEFKAQVIEQVQIDILNGGGVFVPESVVIAIRNQVKNTQDIFTGLTGDAIVEVLGTDSVSTKVRKRRNNNRARQRQYRNTHERYQLWVAPDLEALTAQFKLDVRAIIEAREET